MIRSLFLTLCFLSATAAGVAQFNIVPGGKPLVLGKDTLCFSYDLRTGDTLIYTLEAMDSVDVVSGQRFAKFRSEAYKIICDSVSPSGIMHLTMGLVFAAERHVRGVDTTTRTTHPWIGRRQFIGIDRLGHRAYARSDNDTSATVSPGGAFQPMLLPIIDTSCGRQQQSWLSQDTVLLVENAVPNPVLIQQNFWRVLDHFDTLGRKTLRIQYTQTGNGAVVLRSRGNSFQTQSLLAGYGLVTFDRALNVILHQFATVENKFTMTVPGGIEVKGTHQTTETITLRELRSPDPRRRWSKDPSPAKRSKTNH
ncbi:MAG: hypothetical protein KA339_03635 [Candidatus Kapabacteria bacterium]|nr:hypothetical protein [Ignavibacteria bacterium]MBP6509622.1 hypothetical protein [Candidatus Kapabacteria bacterium]MBK6417590.1 hypothetical protein [Ignavibacteria bacterium]MBK6761438.1 hypothetical protein [Ignavibacteria bacterium]MBK7033460.1 hypothetical protein [Ignavibacteria bacterium]